MYFGSKEIRKREEHKATLIDYFNTVFIDKLFMIFIYNIYLKYFSILGQSQTYEGHFELCSVQIFSKSSLK